MRTRKFSLLGLLSFTSLTLLLCAATGLRATGDPDNSAQLTRNLSAVLRDQGFTGKIGTSIEKRLGRRIDSKLAEAGRLLWFDTIGGLNNDNTCGGCHSPTNGMGDTQSIAIGIDSNGVVGPHRSGPRNQRRTPTAANSAFYPNLMWNSRFASLSGDPSITARVSCSRSPKGCRFPISRNCSWRRHSFRLRNVRKSPGSSSTTPILSGRRTNTKPLGTR